MKKFTIEVSHATPQQLQTIGLELKIMSNGWTKHARTKAQAPSSKPQYGQIYIV